MVLLNAIVGATLGALEAWTDADAGAWPLSLLIYVIAGSISVLTLLVVWLLGYLAIRKPSYLFNPSDIASDVHAAIYGPTTPAAEMEVTSAELASWTVVE